MVLWLHFTQITDAGLVHLKGMNLKNLTIPKPAQTDLGLKHFMATVEHPSALRLGNWEVTDAGLASLAGTRFEITFSDSSLGLLLALFVPGLLILI